MFKNVSPTNVKFYKSLYSKQKFSEINYLQHWFGKKLADEIY